MSYRKSLIDMVDVTYYILIGQGLGSLQDWLNSQFSSGWMEELTEEGTPDWLTEGYLPTLRASRLYRDSGVGGWTVKSGMINRLPKEKCDHCSKVISLGLPHFECFNCTRILHAKCFKASKAEVVNDNFYCTHCKHSISKKYNPFKLMTDPELNECDPCLQKIADILESCRSYSINDMNTLMKP